VNFFVKYAFLDCWELKNNIELK